MEVKKIKRKFLLTSFFILTILTLTALPVYSQESTIVDIAVADPDNFSTLVTALITADLVEVLNGDGSFTVFAPTNDAFDALPEGVLESLLGDIDALSQVLTYHVVAGEAFAADLSDGDMLTAIQGDSLEVSIDGTVMINQATVIIADVDASNGVIHVIDEVLVPEGIFDPSNDAIVNVLSSAGGTTDPAPGSYIYPEGTTITLTATPNEGFEFLYWVVSGEFTPGQITGVPNNFDEDIGNIIIPSRFPDIDYMVITANPAEVICGYGYTYQYQAIFAPIVAGIQPPQPVDFLSPLDGFTINTRPDESTFIILSSTEGGTTSPNTGTYLLTSQVEPDITISATPDEGYEFQYWIVTGNTGDPSLDDTIITENPLDIMCGRGYSYEYEAVFTEEETEQPTEQPTEPEEPIEHPFGLAPEILTALIVILVIALITAVAFGLYAYNRNK